MLENQKRTFSQGKSASKNTILMVFWWFSRLKREILTFLGRKNHFLIIKYFFKSSKNFSPPDSCFLPPKTGVYVIFRVDYKSIREGTPMYTPPLRTQPFFDFAKKNLVLTPVFAENHEIPIYIVNSSLRNRMKTEFF